MKYKTYDPKTKKAEWIDEENLSFPKGINSFDEFLEKYGHVIEDEKEIQEMEKAFSELEDDENN